MNISRSYQNWRSYRKTLAELRGMTDRNLSDVGIARADIRAIARISVK